MAAGIVLVTKANQWVITFTGSAAAGFTLPFNLWPAAGYAGPISPFIVQRAQWTSVSAAAGDQVIITDAHNSSDIWMHFVATGADFQPPQPWSHNSREGAPYGAIITQFDSGELILYI
jgi:hypothetical protein